MSKPCEKIREVLQAVTDGDIELFQSLYTPEIAKSINSRILFDLVLSQDNVPFLIYLHQIGLQDEYIEDLCGKHGCFQCFKWIATNRPVELFISRCAAKYGRFEMMKWIYEKGKIFDEESKLYRSIDTSLDAAYAAKGGSLECLKLALTKETILNVSTIRTSLEGDVTMEIVKFIVEHEKYMNVGPQGGVLKDVIVKGEDEIFHYLVSKGYDASGECFLAAAEFGNFEILKVLYDKFPDKAPRCGEYSKVKNLDCIKYLVENVNCEFTLDYSFAIGSDFTLEEIEYLYERNMLPFCKTGGKTGDRIIEYVSSVPVVEYLLEKGCVINHQTVKNALSFNKMNVAKYCMQNGVKFDETMYTFLFNFNIHFLDYCLKNCSSNFDPKSLQTKFRIKQNSVRFVHYLEKSGFFAVDDIDREKLEEFHLEESYRLKSPDSDCAYCKQITIAENLLQKPRD